MDEAAGPCSTQATAEGDERASRAAARVGVYGFVVLLAVFGIGQFEAWPLSSFRLFSEVRTGERSEYVISAIDAGGRRERVALGGHREACGPVSPR